ncbi:HAMP domain-containing histidine kinase [Pseudoclavibacter endophyticus]|uniref:histidine kinase n=2 Tax=Pseudoclavibacter endophyticus TaxID=1778590 RepID=A0A6H9WQR5_9MICO|nr:HAMP domain-containing histidine kinase [Pseudoclavibacter endophyticus]
MLGIVVAGIGTTLLLRPTLVAQLDSELTAVAADPVSVIGGDQTTRSFTYDNVRQAPQPYYVAVVDDRGQVLVDNWGTRPRAVAPSLAPVEGLASAPGGESGAAPHYTVVDMSDGLGTSWRAVVVLEGDYPSDQVNGTLVIGLPLATVNSTMASFLAIFFGFGLTVVIFGAALTRLLVSATLQPLRSVESTAMSFAAGDYAQRLPESTPNTEVGRLSRSLNMMLSRIDEALDERQATIARMRRFVGDASHELRTPLVTVRGYAELYRMGALDEPAKVGQAMDRIEKEALRMGGLVEDLLQLARLDETRQLEKSIVDLEPIAEDAAMDARAQSPNRPVTALPTRVVLGDRDTRDERVPTAPALADARVSEPRGDDVDRDDDAGAGTPDPGNGSASEGEPEPAETAAKARRRWRPRTPTIPRVSRQQLSRLLGRGTVTTSTPEQDEAAGRVRVGGGPDDDDFDIPAMVLGNEDKMRQAVSNIIGNALRYTPEDSPLEVGVVLDVPKRTATVEVIDHGEGIPPETRDKIFQRFWRADTSRARETGGSGLGLAIVTAIMRAHDGSVDVVETPAGGATFRLTFPLLVADDVDGPSPTGGTGERAADAAPA